MTKNSKHFLTLLYQQEYWNTVSAYLKFLIFHILKLMSHKFHCFLFLNFSLQQINQILHEKIESQAKQQHQLKLKNNNYMVDRQSCGTQTLPQVEKSMCASATVSTQTEPKSPIASPVAKASAPVKKSIKQNISTKEETHLLATIRGMRVDLAIKEKALQRLTRELDECKKTIKKLQKENESM